jgi:hypothetical protein
VFINFLSDAEKQLATEKESLENLRKQIGEAQKQSGKRKFEFSMEEIQTVSIGNPNSEQKGNPKAILSEIRLKTNCCSQFKFITLKS